jgi:hypothetical protein
VGEKLSATDTGGSVLEDEQWARPGSLTRGPRLSRRRRGTAHALRARNARLVVQLATVVRVEAPTRRAAAAAGRARGELGWGMRPSVLGRGAGGPRGCLRALGQGVRRAGLLARAGGRLARWAGSLGGPSAELGRAHAGP